MIPKWHTIDMLTYPSTGKHPIGIPTLWFAPCIYTMVLVYLHIILVLANWPRTPPYIQFDGKLSHKSKI